MHGFCQKMDFIRIRFFFSKKERKKNFLIFWIENKVFWTSKVKFSQSRKKSTFCKGVSPWFLSKNRPFFICFFLAKKAREKHFLIFWIENKVFWTSKVKFSQSRKKSTFCKGVSPWFLSKNRPLFICFFFSKKGQRETFFDILDRKECHLDLKSEVLTKSKNIVILEGVSPWFFSKKIDLFLCLFFNKKSQQEHFLIFWRGNKAFWTSKVKFSQSRKKSAFCKGFSPRSSSKN